MVVAIHFVSNTVLKFIYRQPQLSFIMPTTKRGQKENKNGHQLIRLPYLVNL